MDVFQERLVRSLDRGNVQDRGIPIEYRYLLDFLRLWARNPRRRPQRASAAAPHLRSRRRSLQRLGPLLAASLTLYGTNVLPG